MTCQYLYAGPYRTKAKAELVLEDMFATGDVFESEKPSIVKTAKGYWIAMGDDGSPIAGPVGSYAAKVWRS